jgi:hypothetical protein
VHTFYHTFENPLTTMLLLIVMPSLMCTTVGVYMGLAISDSAYKACGRVMSEHKDYGSTQPLWPKPVEAL